jgi:8-oxo-dGTP diphosphatase
MNVVAALIERDGQVLICQRKTGRHAHKWEFPGGKIEPGESPQQALARELREELAIEARIGEELYRTEFRYGQGPRIRLKFFRVREFAGEPVNLQFERIEWAARDALPGYNFLEGDVEFVRSLAAHRL